MKGANILTIIDLLKQVKIKEMQKQKFLYTTLKRQIYLSFILSLR